MPSSLVVTFASSVVASAFVAASASYLVEQVACKLAFTPFAQELPASLACPHQVRLAVQPNSTTSHLVLKFQSWELHLPSSLPLLDPIPPSKCG